jgi:O-antigen ligase
MSTPTIRAWWRPDATPSSVTATAASERVDAVAPESPIPFWALMAFTAIMLLAPQNYFPILATFRLAFLVAGVAIGMYVYDRLRRGQPLTILAPEVRLVGYLLAWVLATLPLGSWPGGSVGVLTDLYAKTLAIFLLIANTVNSVARLRLIVGGMSLMAVPIAFTGVRNFLSGAYIFGGDNLSAARITGYESALTANPNDLALILNLIIPLALGLALVTRRPLLRAVLLLSVGLQIAAVIVTFSRAGFLSLATILGTYFWTVARRPERGWAYAALIVVVSALPLLPASYLTRLSTITNMEADATGSAQERYAQQVAAVHYVLAHPIVGAGLGMNILAINETGLSPAWMNIHNVYLQYATDLGLPGLILFLLIFLGGIKSAHLVQRRTAGSPESRDLFYLATGIKTSLLSFAISAFFSPVAYHFQFYYIAGLAVAARAVEETAGRAPHGGTR